MIKMERKIVLKWVSIFSVSFFILSIVELLDFIIFSTVITMDLDGQLTIFNVIFQSGFMSFHAPLLWIILLCVICAFIALAFQYIELQRNKSLKILISPSFCCLLVCF